MMALYDNITSTNFGYGTQSDTDFDLLRELYLTSKGDVNTIVPELGVFPDKNVFIFHQMDSNIQIVYLT